MTSRNRTALLSGLLILILLVSGCTGSTVPQAGASRSSLIPVLTPEGSAPVSTGPGELDGDGVGDAPSLADPTEAQAVAEGFVRAWARPDRDAVTWLAGVRPYAAPSYARLLSAVDPTRIPAHRIIDTPRVVTATTAVVVIDVPTDATTVRVTVNHLDDHWLVTGIAITEPR